MIRFIPGIVDKYDARGYFLMTESTTRGFRSQWSYDHDQGHDNGREESTVQWLSVDRAAEQIRRREEQHQLEDDFDTMDFDTRAAALEAHFFHPTRLASPRSGGKSPAPTRPIARVRPQSASVARRVAESNGANASRVRPQSAKTRSEVPCSSNVTQTENHVGWKSGAQQNPRKWREMLARGPEFKQLSLRRLELETYELLYNTLQQQQVPERNSTTRRRKRKNNVGSTDRRPDYSPAPACGSGLCLARSRKERQQEHDRQMMSSGNRRQSSRANEVEKAIKEKRAIQYKTRKRSKLLKKKSLKQFQESQHEIQASSRGKLPKEPCLRRQSSAQRTARGPWIPPGSSSSLALRGVSSGTSEIPQAKRVAQVLEAFRSHADTHLRVSKNVHKQLKKVQQSIKTARERKTRKLEQNVTGGFAKSTRPKSANARVTRQTSDRLISSDEQPHQSYSNQEKDGVDDEMKQNRISFRPVPSERQSPSETLLSEAPATPRLIIPPLKLPPWPWEDSDSLDTASMLSQCSNLDLESAVAGVSNGLFENDIMVDPVDFMEAAISAEAGFVSELKSNNKEKNESETSADYDSTADNIVKLSGVSGRNVDANTPKGSSIVQDTRPDDADWNESVNRDGIQRRQEMKVSECLNSVTIEDGYLAESLMEQASTGLSSIESEPSPVALDCELQTEDSSLASPTKLHRGLNFSGEDSDRANEVFFLVRKLTSPKVVSTLLPVEVNMTISQLAEKEAIVCTTKESTSDSNTSGIGTPSNSAGSDMSCIEQAVSVQYMVNTSQCSRVEAVGLNGSTTHADSVIGISPQSAGDSTVHFVEVSASSERSSSGNVLFDEPAQMAEEAESSLSVIVKRRTASETNCSDEVASTSPDLERKVYNSVQDRDINCGTTMSGNQFDYSITELLDVPPTASESIVLDQASEFVGFLQHLTGPDVMSQVTVTVQLATSEAAEKLDRNERIADAQPPEDNRNHSESDDTGSEQPESKHEETVPLNQVSLVMDPTAARTTQLTTISVPPTGSDESKDELKAEYAITTTTSPSGRNQPPSPQKNITSKFKASSSFRSPQPKKKKLAVLANATVTSLPTQSLSPDAHDSITDLPDKDHLQLHQQTVTRLFLQRVSSRKLIETDSSPSHSHKVLVERDNQSEPATPVTAKATDVVMDIETPLDQSVKPVKKREYIDGHSASLLEHECSQALNDSESTVRVTETFAGTSDLSSSPTKDTSSASVHDGSAATSVMTETLAVPTRIESLDSADQALWLQVPNAPNNLLDDDQEASTQEPSQAASDIINNLLPSTSPDTEGVDLDPTQPSVKYHNAARKIEAQYRCFVRRRLILDQLRFMMAKRRRQTRRKYRHKVKKTKTVDTMGSDLENESPVAEVATETNSVDNLAEEVQQVVPTTVSSEMTPKPSLSEESVPLTGAVRLGVRKDSSEYTFGLFDGSTDAMLDAATVHRVEDSNDSLSIETMRATATSLEKLDAQQRDTKTEDAVLVEVTSEAAKMQPRWDRYVDSASSKSFYYHPQTNETRWTVPDDHAAINSSCATLTTPHVGGATATVCDAVVSPNGQSATIQRTWQEFLDETTGQLYYYNTKTGECSWEPPTDSPEIVESLESVATAAAANSMSPWIMYIDPISQAPYYVNMETLAASWEQPEDFVVTAIEDAYVIAIDDHATLEV